MHSVEVLVEDGHPRRILHDVIEDGTPKCGSILSLAWTHHRVRLCGSGVDVLIAVPRPVPATLHRTAAAKNRPIEAGWVGEIGDPSHAARPDHGRVARFAARLNHG